MRRPLHPYGRERVALSSCGNVSVPSDAFEATELSSPLAVDRVDSVEGFLDPPADAKRRTYPRRVAVGRLPATVAFPQPEGVLLRAQSGLPDDKGRDHGGGGEVGCELVIACGDASQSLRWQNMRAMRLCRR
jgi:hypothetical protein